MVNRQELSTFAVMRNSHEAIRNALKELSDILDGPESGFADFQTLWTTFGRCIAVHTEMEDKDMFPLLAQANGGPIGLEECHVEDIVNKKRVSQTVDDFEKIGDKAAAWQALRDAYKVWHDYHVPHLKREEEIMMPITMKVGSTPEERARMVHKHLVTTALTRDAAEFEHYVGWCVGQLSKHGSTQHSPEVATRVFVRALWSASSAAQWQRFRPIIEANCTPEQWKAMVSDYQVDTPVGDDWLGLTVSPTATAAPMAPTTNDTSQSTAVGGGGGSGGCCVVS